MTARQSWQPDICIYHAPCDDGFGAAWIVWKKWGNQVRFHGMNYGQSLPDVTGQHVLFVDFSVSADKMRDLAKAAKSIILLDHHKTAEKELATFASKSSFSCETVAAFLQASAPEICPVISLFDMNKSGASMAWEFCFPTQAIPEFIRYIEDQDLWTLKMPDIQSFSLALRSYDYDFTLWDQLASDIPSLIEQGKHIKRFYDKKVDDICAKVVFKTIAGHHIPTVNAPHFMASDVAHQMLKIYPDAAFAACWYDGTDGISFSLRSENHRADVSKIAEEYGGGGHRNAAGFRLTEGQKL